MAKKKRIKPYKGLNNDFQDLSSDFKKIGNDFAEIYKKLGYRIHRSKGKDRDWIKILALGTIVILLIFSRIGIPILLIVLIFILISKIFH